MPHLLEAKDIRTCFRSDGRDVAAVDGVSLHLDPGEIIGIVGESGSGKSVTMLSILQLVSSPRKIAGGQVHLNGAPENLLDYAYDSDQMRRVRGGEISMIFQEPMTSLNPVLTIGYQIQESIMLHLGLDKQAARERTIEMLKLVKIPDAEQRFDYYPQQFSGGMRQRIMIAMAMAPNPTVLIADEATTALDVTTQAQLLELLRDIAKKTNTAVVIVTHNLGIVARYAEHIYVMYSGHVVETAGTRALFASPEHPYTRGLLKAIPRLDDPKDRVLIPIDGLPMNPADRPSYCPFYDRCQYRMEKCRENECPGLKPVGTDHWAACWLTHEEMEARGRELKELGDRRAPRHTPSRELCLDVKEVSKKFPVFKGLMRRQVGEVCAIEDVTFSVRKGETLGIAGESGCGKTTLARCIMRVYEPNSGTIEFCGRDITHCRDRALREIRPRMSMIFQDPSSSLDPRKTVESIVSESLRIHGLAKGAGALEKRVDELLNMVGLDPSLKDRYPHEFSGGQRQRIGIARALSSNPDLIVCDEPISALDVSIQAQVINLLEELQQKLGLTYLFIAHDLAVVKHISDRVLVMYLGNVVEIAPCEELYSHTLHPYTQALISAVPVADPGIEAGRVQEAIRGEVPSLTNRPKGCPFSDRCPHVSERCRNERPRLKTVEKEHSVACFLYES